MTNQQEKEVLTVYNHFWNSYISGEVSAMATFLHEDVHVFGSTLHEAFTDKPSAVAYYQATAGQISNKVELRNKKIELQTIDKNIMVTEQSDFYLLIDNEWTFYGNARLSTLFTSTDNGWKIIHQHGSFPDSKTEEGEQVATEKIKDENLKLKEAIKSRTVELENKNRELEIEAALERVRGRTMAMHKSEELAETAVVVFQQLISLGIEPNRLYIGIIKDESGDMEMWATDEDGTKVGRKFMFNKNENASVKKLYDGWAAKEKYVMMDMQGKELKDYFHYLNHRLHIPFKDGLSQKRRVQTVAYFNKGFIGMASPDDQPGEAIQLLERFAGVFNLTYTRFLDLQKAEAQSREAQIELALERVRARAMSMQKSEELKELIGTVFSELTKLDLVLTRCLIMIYEPGNKGSWWWMANSEAQHEPIGLFVPYHEYPPHIAYLKAWEERRVSWQYNLQGQIKKDWDEYLFSQTDLARLPDFVIAGMKAPDSVILSASFNNFGNLTLATLQPLSQEQRDILLRFAKVFDLTYTRFNDLQKAEAQAREAEIELGLERVRARTMAMQKSDELLETSMLLFKQLRELGETADQVSIAIVNEEEGIFELSATVYGNQMVQTLKLRLDEPFALAKVYQAWKKKQKNIVIELAGEVFKNYNIYRNNLLDTKVFNEEIMPGDRWIICAVCFSKGALIFSSAKEVTKERLQLLERFAIVFEQTYTRFLDLQKAEAQAREAQIESALERVRARAMAMQNSDDVAAATGVMFKELFKMGIETLRCGILFIHENKTMEVWNSYSDKDGEIKKVAGLLDMNIHPLLQQAFIAWQNKEEIFQYKLHGDDRDAYYKAVSQSPTYHLPVYNEPLDTHYCNIYLFEEGGLYTFTQLPASAENQDVMKKFTTVFSLTFRRYQDLKRAEAQAREAQIEAALERVRSQSMAMHKSGDLLEVISVLSNQLLQLGFKIDSANFNTSYREKDWNLWLCNPGRPMYPDKLHIPYFDHPYFNRSIESLAKGNDFHTFVFSKEEKDTFLNHLYSNTIAKNTAEEVKKTLFSKPGFAWSAVYLKNICITIANYDAEPYTEEQNLILRRFGNAFEQSYTRFLDLQKAEAQAREAKIESALERIRAASMSMHSSEQLSGVIKTVTDQLLALGFSFETANFITNFTDKGFNLWLSVPGVEHPSFIYVPYDDNAFFRFLHQGVTLKKEFDSVTGSKEDKDKFFNHFFTKSDGGNIPDERKKYVFDKPGIGFTTAFRKHFYFTIVNYEGHLHSSEENSILGRFANVFEQSYTRFLDLRKAESQTREAEIQLSLERVRARTMAMQRSEELAETCELLFEEFRKLRIVKADQLGTNDRATIGIFNEADGTYDFSVTGLDGKKLDYTYRLSFDEPTTLAKAYAAWKEGKPLLVIDLHGDELNRWFNYLKTFGVPVNPALHSKRRINTWAFFSKGNLGITSNEPLPEESLQLLQRFADTFNLTYTRFQDLKDAEARTEIAIKEASLDRVRGEIASMRTAEDLQHITPLVWRELTALGVPFFRCGVFIVDDEKQMIHFYLSASDGKPLAALELPIDATAITQNATAHWREQKVYISHWSKEEFLQFAQDLLSQGQIQNVNTYQGGRDAPESLTLQFVPFTQGMMYVGSAEDLSSTQIELVQSLADAFSTAYARYEDFNKLEAAKQQVESTLKDLRATQTQLIQSEKMASLGELTAGIAHEIQNPLNFVNNFSEVSTELVDEMNEEIKKGNLKDAQQIAQDLKENLSKINHHGKRAGDIVKGMLQHSRSSSGIKEPTDINALADEYLRLAYHGLRAKDKSFNATMITDFDDSIGMINIIPQDMGRVILNLITNAFYAVNTPQPPEGGAGIPTKKYEPTVTISTSIVTPPSGGRGVNGRKVMISVKDNGPGIPQNIVDKIFQPFFTTKPTGQGTGLGLSLSYDIVKAHGGELKVETKVGEGTKFYILLPA